MKFRVSSEYGVLEEVRKGAHTGIDLAMPEGTQLRSIYDGVVTNVFDGSGAIGKGVKIHTEEGKDIIYGHMSDVDVKIGESLNKGDMIGLSGNTGNSTGPHLHFGMKENGHFVDPSQHAEQLSSMSGGFDFKSPFQLIMERASDRTAEHISQVTQDVLLGIAQGIVNFTVDMAGFITLVGCTLLIIFKVVGFDKGFKWAGILFTANLFISYLGGGGS